MTGDNVREMGTALASFLEVEPKDIYEVMTMKGNEGTSWRAASDKEIATLLNQGTWRLVPPDPKIKPIDSGWTFVVKRDGEGEVIKYKARMFAKGYTQRPGIDFTETYAPVIKAETFRLMVALCNAWKWKRRQADAPSAYLNGIVKEKIHMKQPPGYVVKGKERWVCELVKTLYGLKQAGNEWNEVLNACIVKMGFRRCVEVDECLYVLSDDSGPIAMIGTHVDDMPIIARDDKVMEQICATLKEAFNVTIEDLSHFCGIRVQWNDQEQMVTLSQEAYIDKMLHRFEMTDCKTHRTPADPNVILTKEMEPTTEKEVEYMRDKPYKELVGALQFASAQTRCDINFAVQRVSTFQRNPGKAHWKAARRILKYLKGQKKLGITFRGKGISFSNNADDTASVTMTPGIEMWTDADFAGDRDDRKSTSGITIRAVGGPVSTGCRKQGAVSTSTTQAEIQSLSKGVMQLRFIVQLLEAMGVKVKQPVPVNEDNQAAVSYATNAKNQSKVKHMDVKHCYIRDEAKKGRIEVKYCPTDEMIADMFTKALPASQFEFLRLKLGMTEGKAVALMCCVAMGKRAGVGALRVVQGTKSVWGLDRAK
jgi:hypothetical protein